VAPTLLEAAGLPVPESMQGRSLMPILTGAADPHTHKSRVICEFKDAIGGPQHTDHSHGSMVFDGRYKSVVYHGHDIGEIYDLENDPGEFDNLWNQPQSRDLKSTLLKQHLDAMMATVSAGPPRSVAY
jgi:arylsulfatase A-like enzyme